MSRGHTYIKDYITHNVVSRFLNGPLIASLCLFLSIPHDTIKI